MTRLLRWITLGALLGVLLLAAPLTARAADPMAGTWQLNVKNSMYDPGPAPKSGTRTVTIDGDTITVSADLVAEDGTTRQVRYTAKLDGTDAPATGIPNADTISLKRTDARTLEATQKKGGKVTSSGKHRVSEDGSELEISVSGKNEKGEEFNYLMVYDKKR